MYELPAVWRYTVRDLIRLILANSAALAAAAGKFTCQIGGPAVLASRARLGIFVLLAHLDSSKRRLFTGGLAGFGALGWFLANRFQAPALGGKPGYVDLRGLKCPAGSSVIELRGFWV